MFLTNSIIYHKHRFIRFNNKHRVFISKNYQDVKSGLSKYYAPVEPVANKAVKPVAKAVKPVKVPYSESEEGIERINALDNLSVAEYNIEKIKGSFPGRCLAGNSKKSGRFTRARDAREMDYVNLNHGGMRYIILDVDSNIDAVINDMKWAGVPAYSFMVLDKSKNTGQIFWRLKVSVDYKNIKPTNYALAIHKSLSRFLGADENFNNQYTKNPLAGDYWDVRHGTDKSYALDDFKEFLVGGFVPAVGSVEAEIEGRNVNNFRATMRECSQGGLAQDLLSMEPVQAEQIIAGIYDKYNCCIHRMILGMAQESATQFF